MKFSPQILNRPRWLYRSLPFAVSWALQFAASTLLAQTNGGASEDELKLLPPHGEIAASFWELHGNLVLIIGAGTILIAVFAVWLWLRPKPALPLPPATQARLDLETLRLQPEDGKCLSQVSQIVRRYFIAAFQMPAGELTTAEFTREISRNEKAGAELSASVTGFLRSCDERKFSSNAAVQTGSGAVQQALSLVESAEDRRKKLAQEMSATALSNCT